MVFSALLFIGYLVYNWATKNYNYFKDKNIVHGKPIFFFGTGKDLILQKISLPDYVSKWYNKFPSEK